MGEPSGRKSEGEIKSARSLAECGVILLSVVITGGAGGNGDCAAAVDAAEIVGG